MVTTVYELVFTYPQLLYINNDSAMLLLNFQQFGCHAICVTYGMARRDLVDVLFVNGCRGGSLLCDV